MAIIPDAAGTPDFLPEPEGVRKMCEKLGEEREFRFIKGKGWRDRRCNLVTQLLVRARHKSLANTPSHVPLPPSLNQSILLVTFSFRS